MYDDTTPISTVFWASEHSATRLSLRSAADSQKGLKFSRLFPITGLTAVEGPGSKDPTKVNGKQAG
jgi:hypothetical protein